MPGYTANVIPEARAAVDASSTGASTQTTFMCVASRAIVAACDASAYTCTMSISGITTVDLQWLLEVLHSSGYNTSISSTTLTINWN